MLFSASFFPLVLGIGAAAAPSAAWKHTIKESHGIPSKWTHISHAPSDYMLKVDIALKQSQFDQLERELYEVSDPDHARYGQHLSQKDVQSLIKPSDATLTQVHDWLTKHGIAQSDLTYSPAKDWISIMLPVATLENMLHTKYSIFQDKHGDIAIRTTSGNWSLPEHLHSHIDLISPTTSFFRPRSSKSSPRPVEMKSFSGGVSARFEKGPDRRKIADICDINNVDTLCLRTYYGTIDYIPKVPGKSKVALSNYLGESSNRSDARIFLEKYRPDAVSGADSFKFVSINGGPTYQGINSSLMEQGIELEGDLEVETITGLTYPIPLTVYTTAGTPPFVPDVNSPTDGNEPYLDWMNYVLAQSDLPQSISNSYDDDEQTVPFSYAKRVCDGMAQLGARGVSVFFPSGDSGVGVNGTCISNSGCNKGKPAFIPTFPPSCPYVTTVGGTMHFSPEVVAYDPPNNYTQGFSVGYYSGGGFSNYFSRPSYQQGIVDTYVASLKDKYKGLYNKNGRGYPDLATQAVRIADVWNGTLVHIDGTKCGMATSIFALVNDALMASGKPPMGFLNPWLYKRGHAAMNDILHGSSVGCDTAGFPAQKGWDAATGFGSPMFNKILDQLQL